MAICFLILFAMIYCLAALIAPFWNDNDTWSNLLPVIHYRQSILNEHTLPLYTELWYGGRAQWANPLWSFLYLPATLVWLTTPLDWGTRIVFLGHFIFALLAARKLVSLSLQHEIERVCAAIILCSPILPALTAGHVEKVMSWGWVLLSLYFLLNSELTAAKRGLFSGICLGIIPLTGANYYPLYAALLLIPLALSYKDRKLMLFFVLGASLGLLHIPSVWQMVGHPRAHAKFFVALNSIKLIDIALSLSTGISRTTSWETWAPVGLPTLYIVAKIIATKIRQFRAKHDLVTSNQNIAVLISTVILILLATGIAYQGHNLLDAFRVPSRAMAFIALAIMVFVLMNVRIIGSNHTTAHPSIRFLLVLSALQIMVSGWQIRPLGSVHSPYDPAVQNLADTLRADSAKRVWFSEIDLGYMYIHVGLNRNRLSLPVVYYGDMGQKFEIAGNHCGYSFDHLIARLPIEGSAIELNSNVEWSQTKSEISLDQLFLIKQLQLGNDKFNVYRVKCNE
jgi:hypothetical protein